MPITIKVKKPFVVSGYESPEYFCDIEKETKELLGSLIVKSDFLTLRVVSQR